MKARSTTSTPQVSVVMSVYNGELFLRRAIDSILTQTFKRFELIIINDGSTDSTQEIIDSYADARIVSVHQTNHGLIYSLNRGIKMARSDIIARQDADDISERSRLEKQVRVMEKYDDITVVGSSFIMTNPHNKPLATFVPPTSDLDIRRQMYSRNPLCHGSVMMRRSAVTAVGGYSASAYVAEDYDLWIRLTEAGYKFASILEPLYRWQQNPNGVSWNNDAKQAVQVKKLRAKLWRHAALPEQSVYSLVLHVWSIRLSGVKFAARSARQLALDQYRLMRLGLNYGVYSAAILCGVAYVCMLPFNITSCIEIIGLWFIRSSRHAANIGLRFVGLRA